jgi:hypothetical protein
MIPPEPWAAPDETEAPGLAALANRLVGGDGRHGSMKPPGVERLIRELNEDMAGDIIW